MAALVVLWPRPARADAPVTRPAELRPLVQLTTRLPDLNNNDIRYAGDTLLREIQRQAVLIAAREELGLRTRDMSLDEQLVSGRPGVTTVLAFTAVRVPDRATLTLARCDAVGVSDTSDPGDVLVGDKRITDRVEIDTPISANEIPDYLPFVADCEKASRGQFVEALKTERVLGQSPAVPTRWVDSGALDPDAAARLGQLDPFDQFMAVRIAQRQTQADGASYERVDAVVRGYANLSVVTRAQWSWENNAFAARALLYAERLVVHENKSPRSLRTRAYARALVGLHAAALADLAASDQSADPPPGWVAAVRGLCKYDLQSLAELSATGPWTDRELAGMMLGVVCTDGYPSPTTEAVIARLVGEYPGLFFLAVESGNPAYAANGVIAIPAVLRESLATAKVSPVVTGIVNQLSNRSDGYSVIARVRDRLNSESETDAVEPSLSVLGGLIEEQTFAAIVRRASSDTASYQRGGDTNGLQTYANTVCRPILNRHPWGLIVARLKTTNTATSDKDFDAVLARPRPRDNGWWIDAVNRPIVLSDAEQHKLEDQWVSVGHKLGAHTPYQYAHCADFYSGAAALDPLWRAYRNQSPYCSAIATWWVQVVPRERWVDDKPLYDSTIAELADRFYNRPDAVQAVVETCQLRGDFDRANVVLARAIQSVPWPVFYEGAAVIARHQGRVDQALSLVDRAQQTVGHEDISGSVTSGTLMQLKARILLDAGRFEAAQAVLSKTDPSNDGTVGLQARCFELSGRDDEALNCLRVATGTTPPALYQAYFFARRRDRSDAESLHKAAQAQAGTSTVPQIMIGLADGADQKAFELIKPQDSTSIRLQLERLILATEFKDAETIKSANESLRSGTPPQLGRALDQLAGAADPAPGLVVFDQFESVVLDTETLVQFDSFMARYLLVTGHKPEAIRYLTRALRRSEREDDSYFLAWSAALRLGLDPAVLAKPEAPAGK